MSVRTASPSGVAAVARPGSLPDEARIRKSASDFEAMVVDQMLQPMFATMGQQGGMFDGGAAEQTLKPLLVTEFAKMMQARGGLGLEKPILAVMLNDAKPHR